MGEKILIGLVSALIALVLRECWAAWQRKKKKEKLAALIKQHLMQIQKDLTQHVRVRNKQAEFNSTLYCEIVVGDFLYDLLISNLDLFPKVGSIEKTVTFFHHYKINMSTVKSRLEASSDNQTFLTEGTYNNLIGYLKDAIEENDEISGT